MYMHLENTNVKKKKAPRSGYKYKTQVERGREVRIKDNGGENNPWITCRGILKTTGDRLGCLESNQN